MDDLAAEVLANFPLPGNVTLLRHRGGFSGARVWRVQAEAGVLCLRAWPANVDAAAVHAMHALLGRAQHLAFVPQPLPARGGLTTLSAAGRVWELTTWLPGHADFHDRPSAARLRNACITL